MLELWIDEEYKADVYASPYSAHHEPDHSCYRVIIRDVNELDWLTESWETIASHFGFQPESVVYCH